MKKKIGLVALALAIMLPLTSCSKSQNNESNSSKGETTELKMSYVTFGGVPKDLDAVTSEINKITKEKINTIVKIEPINVGAYSQQINLKLSSNEDLDMFITGNLIGLFDFSGQAAKGQLYDLTDLIKESGQGIEEALGTDFLNAAKVGGKLYALPNVKDMASGYGLYMRKDLADKYGIDVYKIQTLNDLEAVLKTMKEKEPNLYLGVSGGTSVIDILGVNSFGDNLGDGLGVLMSTDSKEIVNYYETPEYANLLKKVRNWYTEGYILPDVTTNKESTQVLIKANKTWGNLGNTNIASETTDTRGTGQPIQVNSFVKQISTTQAATNFMWAIPSYSKKADKTMEFLNLMYSDKDVFNLFAYGIEGKHYQKVSGTDNIIDFAAGVDAQSSGYNLGQPFMFGNEFIGKVWNGSPEDIWGQMDRFNKESVKSIALGFLFDTSTVKTEYAAVSNVIGEYKLALENGAVDPEKVLPEFLAKLKEAGIDKIIAEKQKQLDKWFAGNK